MNNIINGKNIASSILEDLKIECTRLTNGAIVPLLSIVLVGDNAASKVYISNKIKAASFVGIRTRLIQLKSDISEKNLLDQIERLNADNDVSAIIVQLPLPSHISKSKIIESINPNKDVDGFHPINIGRLYSGKKGSFVPCTALGCLELIKASKISLPGKNVVMIGRSIIVGRPLAALLLNEDCTVTICHSKTQNLKSITQNADIIISAIGIAKYLTRGYFSKKAVVIDVGISRIKIDGEYKICGDVDFENVKNYVSYVTPVPGGVGPMTVAFLLANTLKSFKLQHAI